MCLLATCKVWISKWWSTVKRFRTFGDLFHYSATSTVTGWQVSFLCFLWLSSRAFTSSFILEVLTSILQSIADLQIHLQTGLRSDQSLQLIRRIKAFQPLWHSCANSWRRESSRSHNITPSAMKTESLWSVSNRYSNIHHLKYFAAYSRPYCRWNLIRLDPPKASYA